MGGMIGHEEQATKIRWRRASKQKEWQFQRLEPEGVCKPQGITYFSQCFDKIPGRRNLREGGRAVGREGGRAVGRAHFGSQFEDTVHRGGEGMATGMGSIWSPSVNQR